MRAPLVHLILVVAACDGTRPECRVGADCASGICHEDGTCAGGDDLPDAGHPGADAAGDPPDAGVLPDGSGTTTCLPDHDGVIARDEAPLAAGLAATFRVAGDVTISTAGADVGGGERRWDLSGALAGDHAVLVETQPMAGKWFADAFAGASYAARLRDDSDLLGVFQVTETALLLRGVVSPDGGLYRTELSYDPPVTVLAFPFEQGSTWTTETSVTGVALGVYSLFNEGYASAVDASGTLVTPFGEFPVLRIAVDLTRTVGFAVTTVRSFLFAAECFGTVASMVSQDNEPQAEFSDVSEVRRLSP